MTVGYSAKVSVELCRAGDRTEVGLLWLDLEAQISEVGLTSSWAWTETWLDVYGDVVPHKFAVATTDGQVVGVALVTSASLPGLELTSFGIVQFGTTNEPRGHSVDVEYNSFLVEEELRPVFLQALLSEVRRQMRPIAVRFKAFELAEIQPALRTESRFQTARIPCPVFELEQVRENGGEAIGALRSSVRSRIRRSIKTLGHLQEEWASSLPEATDIFDELIDLHQRRWRAAGRPGAFSSDRFTRFHRRLIERLLPAGQIILFRVMQDQRSVGCLYSFVDRGMVMFYQSGFREEDDNRIKPGLTTHMLCIDACVARGFHTYNFLGGQQRYKDELATGSRDLVTAHAWSYPFFEPVVNLVGRSGAVDQARRIKRWRERALVGGTL